MNEKQDRCVLVKFVDLDLEAYTLPTKGALIIFEPTPEGYRSAFNWICSNPFVRPLYRLVIPYASGYNDMVDYLLLEPDRRCKVTICNTLKAQNKSGLYKDKQYEIIPINDAPCREPWDQTSKNMADYLNNTPKWPFKSEQRRIDYYCAGYLTQPAIFFPRLLSGLNKIQEEILLGKLNDRCIAAKYYVHEYYVKLQREKIGKLGDGRFMKYLPNFIINGKIRFDHVIVSRIIVNKINGRHGENELLLISLEQKWTYPPLYFYHSESVGSILISNITEYLEQWYREMLVVINGDFRRVKTHSDVLSSIEKNKLSAGISADGKRKRFFEFNEHEKRQSLTGFFRHKMEDMDKFLDIPLGKLEMVDIIAEGDSIAAFWKKKIGN